MLMRKTLWPGLVGCLAILGALALPAGPATAVGSTTAYTCTGGSIPSGNYSSITVTGFCDVVPDAVINVTGNINVAAGAVFDAQSAPSTITVGKNVTAAAGSILGLGCQPNGAHAAHPCAIEPDGHSVITIAGNVTTTDADTVLLNGITVNRNVTMTGGGGEFPWPIKNNTIGGNVTASTITPEWFGLLFNHIGGNATLTNIMSTDPEDEGFASVNVVLNTIGRNLNCNGLGPRLSGGFIPGAVNITGGKATGQCAGLVGG
jgi:hypothetical protein